MSVHSDTKYEGVDPTPHPCGKIIKYIDGPEFLSTWTEPVRVR